MTESIDVIRASLRAGLALTSPSGGPLFLSDLSVRSIDIAALLDALDAQDRLLAEAREALRPFAAESEGWATVANDGYEFDDAERIEGSNSLTVGQLRAAALALEHLEQQP